VFQSIGIGAAVAERTILVRRSRTDGYIGPAMRVLVTGSHGYIGSVLAPFLADAGHDVLGLDTRFYRGCDFGEDLGAVPSVERDVRDVGPAELEGLDAIVHLAALSNDPLGDFDPALTEQINRDATLTLARAAREAGVRRFVFASSCSMYGASDSDDALTEDAPLRPLTPYAESKVRSEEGLFELAGPDFAPVSMRNSTVYGSSPRLRLDIVLNNLAAWSHTTGRIRLLSDGSAWRPLVHVRDVAKVALALLEAPEEEISGLAINVGSDAQNYRVSELAALLSTVTGCAVETAEGSVADQRSYRVDFSKLGRLFPALSVDWDADRGANELVDAYRRNGLSREDFDGDRYVRLRRLRHLVDAGRVDDELRWRVGASLKPA
jgi:nucleoside-diphosphate-sugar epimerase